MTYSPVASMLRSVSLSVPERFAVGEKTTEGGLAPPAIKNENGAKLGEPSGDRVETNAIGRGATQFSRRAYASLAEICAGSIWVKSKSCAFMWARRVPGTTKPWRAEIRATHTRRV